MTVPIGFVCTNYNNSAFTRRAVETLSSVGGWDAVRVVIVDNCSREDDVAALRDLQQEYPEIVLLLNDTNVGYFPGLNLGIRCMRARFPDVATMVVGNNDLEFPPAFLDEVRAVYAQLTHWAVLAPDLMTPDGVHQNPHVIRPISSLRRFVWDVYYTNVALASLVRLAARLTRSFTVRAENALGSELWRTPGPVEQGYGACYLLGPRFFQSFTGFYAPTFLMQEEYFLFEQLQSIAQLTYYDPRVVVRHRGHATMGLIPSRRHWELARDAHVIYNAFRRLPAGEQRRRIANAVGLPAGAATTDSTRSVN